MRIECCHAQNRASWLDSKELEPEALGWPYPSGGAGGLIRNLINRCRQRAERLGCPMTPVANSSHFILESCCDQALAENRLRRSSFVQARTGSRANSGICRNSPSGARNPPPPRSTPLLGTRSLPMRFPYAMSSGCQGSWLRVC